MDHNLVWWEERGWEGCGDEAELNEVLLPLLSGVEDNVFIIDKSGRGGRSLRDTLVCKREIERRRREINLINV